MVKYIFYSSTTHIKCWLLLAIALILRQDARQADSKYIRIREFLFENSTRAIGTYFVYASIVPRCTGWPKWPANSPRDTTMLFWWILTVFLPFCDGHPVHRSPKWWKSGGTCDGWFPYVAAHHYYHLDNLMDCLSISISTQPVNGILCLFLLLMRLIHKDFGRKEHLSYHN